ncbi:MAG: PSD1 domain-containing protein [Planctomycetales bacterium]|nr:PSD1 domain-containing protein [Planctomycetales bacterium]
MAHFSRTPIARSKLLQAMFQTPICSIALACFGLNWSLLADDDGQFFENAVRPLLVDHCIKCHGREKQEGGLRLDTRTGLLAGGDSGAAIEMKDQDASLLLSAIRYEDFEMPPAGQLSDDKIEIFERWIALGSPWPDHGSEGGLELRQQSTISDEDRDYWAFRPLSFEHPPRVDGKLGLQVRTPIDQFILAKLAAEGLSLAPEADRRILMRRLYLDLLGVPPSIEEQNDFLNDTRSNAFELLVDRLLDDRRYGEKWARHWLDLVRYAESDGFNQDAARPNAYLYRDWLIQALNDDLPYDQFVGLQLAGDEMAPNDPQALAATGFLRHWIYEYNQRDVRTQWDNILNDMTDVSGEVFLGLGMGCARCHDHKFDPIFRRDYFRFQASFAAFLPVDTHLYATPDELNAYQVELAKWEQATQTIREQMDALEDPIRTSVAHKAFDKFPLDVRPILYKPADERDGYEQQIYDLAFRQVIEEWNKLDYAKSLKGDDKEKWEGLKQQLSDLQLKPPTSPIRILAAGEVPVQPPPTRIPGTDTVIEPAGFEIWNAEPIVAKPLAHTSGRRTALASWINSPSNPLPHRVIVNRIWQYHFGCGIVQNSSDFGRMGMPPSHPELLDWLATNFLENGRSLKDLHRLIVCSSVYRQSSHAEPIVAAQARTGDPENVLLWHYPARRLDAEQIHDSMLVACGALQEKTGGASEPHDGLCRSIFTLVKRNNPDPFLTSFDAPDGNASQGKRSTTTTANQALLLSNSDWPLKLAARLAEHLQQVAPKPEQQIQLAFRRCLQREPGDLELERSIGYVKAVASQLAAQQAELDEQTAAEVAIQEAPTDQRVQSAELGEGAAELAWYETEAYTIALGDFVHVLMNTSEFLYTE